MKFLIIQTEKRFGKQPRKLPESKDITFISNGKIDFTELNNSSFPKEVSKIPIKNQIELNIKGTTSFVVVTRTIISLSKK